MNIHEEQRYYERDYERFRLSERLITHRPKEPIPEGAILTINQDAEEIFGSQSTEKLIVDIGNSGVIDQHDKPYSKTC